MAIPQRYSPPCPPLPADFHPPTGGIEQNLPPGGRPASQCCLRSLWRAEDTVFFLNISCVLLWTLNISRFMLPFASGLRTLPAHENIRGLMYPPGVCSLHRCLGHLQQGEGTMADNSAPESRPLGLWICFLR